MNEKTMARPRSAHAPLSWPAGRHGAKTAHCAIFLRADFGKSCEAVNVNMTLFVFFFLDEKEPKNQGAAIFSPLLTFPEKSREVIKTRPVELPGGSRFETGPTPRRLLLYFLLRGWTGLRGLFTERSIHPPLLRAAPGPRASLPPYCSQEGSCMASLCASNFFASSCRAKYTKCGLWN